jgi:hypothetical protein
MSSATGYCDSAMDRRRRHAVARVALMALALLAAIAGYALAAPSGPPPKPVGAPGPPPPAWIEAGTTEKWLASIFAVRKAGGDASYAVRIKVR